MSFDISGRWEGHYEYHDGGTANGRMVPFTMVLRRSLFRRFSGNAQDDGNVGVPEPASIEGWWKGRTVSFEKRYLRLWVLDDEGKVVLLEEEMLRRHNAYVFRRIPDIHPAVTYAGILNDNNGALMGTWHVPALHLDLSTGGSMIVPECFGTFALRQVRDRVYRPKAS